MRRRRNSRSAAPGVDKISNFPDEILYRILSSLTTKEAVSTTILSKRWTHLCHHVPNLHFTDIKVNTAQSILRFNQSVYSVLVSREAAGSNFINSFRLDIQYGGNPNLAYKLGFPNFTKWVNLVVKRNLQYLHIDVDGIEPKLPISIFTCRTLVSLYIRRFHVKGFSFSSSGFQFPSLKTLHLVTITFSTVKDSVLLLAGCPILEDLEVCDLHWDNLLDSVTIQEYKSLSFPRLTRAHIGRLSRYSFPMKTLTNSERISIATIAYTEVNKSQLPYDDIHIFHNLTHLEIHNNWYRVLQLLHRCPKLQNLKLCQKYNLYNLAIWGFEEEEEDDDDDDDDDYDDNSCAEPEFVPQCLLSYFRTCTMEGFLGQKYDFLVAEYILRNAKNLQTMTIRCNSGILKSEKDFSHYPKASSTCQLSVYNI